MKPIRSASKAEEQPYVEILLGNRNKFLNEPQDVFDPHHRISGRKAFNPYHARQLRSSITLKFPDALNANNQDNKDGMTFIPHKGNKTVFKKRQNQ